MDEDSAVTDKEPPDLSSFSSSCVPGAEQNSSHEVIPAFTGGHSIPPVSISDTLKQMLWPGASPDTWDDWKWQMSHRLNNINGLSVLPGISPRYLARYRQLIKEFHYAVTPYYFSLIDWSDPADPVRKQCLPDLRELSLGVAEKSDPLEEDRDMPVRGLVHRYPDRVLTVITGKCAMYCRHCTRKRLWKYGEEGPVSGKDLAAMTGYIRQNSSIREVIISGGDPLTVNIDVLDRFLGDLKKIPHVEVLRIGTRVPVVLPMRITDDLLRMLASHRPLWLNTQFNHPREITPESSAACDRIIRTGIPVSNQSVLLKGINDSPAVMQELCHGLQRIMVRPYYLFQCDPVTGTDHFRTSVWKGMEIMETMRGHTGGLCIPQFVIDAPGGGGKVPLQPNYLLSVSDNDILIRNYEGLLVKYENPAGTPVRNRISSGQSRRDFTNRKKDDQTGRSGEDIPRLRRRAGYGVSSEMEKSNENRIYL